jgi:hypothetical protein
LKIGSNNQKDFQKKKEKKPLQGPTTNRIALASLPNSMLGSFFYTYISNSMGDKWVKKNKEE